ncbi:MAG: rod shape-determining protein [Patescibacteria group bacterium]|nr:MAG: rod shape-determining protein [Patescibacteria group bacterium]
MKIPIVEKLNKKIGIDIGSSRTRIWVSGAGILINEATCIAFDKTNKSVLAVGDEAYQMDGRVGSNIVVAYPVKDGKVYDMVALTALLKILIHQAAGSITFYNPIIMASVPARATQADKEIVTQVLSSLGAGETYTISQPLAASIGAGVPIADASGSFLLHMGAGVVEGVVISLGSIIVSQSNEYAGEYFSNSIRTFALKNLDLKISKRTASSLKKEVVSVEFNSEREKLVAGQDTINENPKELLIRSKELSNHTLAYLEKVENLVVKLLSQVPPELAVDVIDKGLLLTGGSAKLHGIEIFFVEKLGIPVCVVDNSETAVVEGIGQALENLDLFRRSLGHQE